MACVPISEFDSTKMLTFRNHTIRTAGTPDNPLFCVKDICDALGIKNASDKVRILDDDEKDGIDTIDSIGRRQKKPFCTEAGMYHIIFSTKDTPHTRAFKRWVNHEVLPSIRKTGSYSTRNNSIENIQLERERFLREKCPNDPKFIRALRNNYLMNANQQHINEMLSVRQVIYKHTRCKKMTREEMKMTI